MASCMLVLVVELLNSAIEMVVDRIGPEHHELSGHAKDMGVRRSAVEHDCVCSSLGCSFLGSF